MSELKSQESGEAEVIVFGSRRSSWRPLSLGPPEMKHQAVCMWIVVMWTTGQGWERSTFTWPFFTPGVNRYGPGGTHAAALCPCVPSCSFSGSPAALSAPRDRTPPFPYSCSCDVWRETPFTTLCWGVGRRHQARPNNNTLQLFRITLGVCPFRSVFLEVSQ